MFEILMLSLFLILIWGTVIYNSLIRDKNRVHEGWSDIDVQLKFRHSLVPNLVAATKQYAKYEKAVLSTVIEIRSQSEAISAPSQKGEIEKQLGSGLQKLVALVEQYPELKANENFVKLQDELVAIEEQIQYARRYYNGAVRNFNISIESFPNLVVAKIFSFSPTEYFQLESDAHRKAVSVN